MAQANHNALAAELGSLLLRRKIRCAVAESCTGGGLSSVITEIPGSSQWFERGFVTYSNQAKEDMLRVPHRLIASYGAVSEQTARAMAEGAIAASRAEVSVAITGVAGPGGGSEQKPVGTVWIAWAGDWQDTYSQCYQFKGNRTEIRNQAIVIALQGLLKRCAVLSHPKTSERYFFALWPDEKTAQALYEQARALIERDKSKPTSLQNLHLTLVYLGQVPPEFLRQAMDLPAKIHLKPFAMNICKADSWERAQIAWLGVEQVPAGLCELVETLNHRLLGLGFKPECRPFVPHVTIARKLMIKKAALIPALTWFVRDFCLVKSSGREGQSKYEIVQRWQL
ncbi:MULTISPECIES: RNA 2',3'-cyclic phosphodiesterase [Legionella]|uniref:RNA 2',3'-cyclic phosphodiesterase n=1 Tax=Legionella septentrionalis TaxID=2498109 RepID=A0A433JI98_9GAMM|nr:MULTISPECIES: RNA 2',3'-cyclic phosphodiesterase [Legionella]MCP0914523.1 RNA 2',3'-cyclic phosphodiesterase [Legionella sp. 27cVA30]RUQ85002.1 RNA 2',3'-cyclic phosphodiesterase [Legionella septentrionalis]